ncbi:unnamed protein product [Calypogeia fissa]
MDRFCWMKDGIKVGLCYESRIIGSGVIQSVDPLRLCHSVELGRNDVLVSVDEVFDESYKDVDGEFFSGTLLRWRKDRIRSLEVEGLIVEDGGDECQDELACDAPEQWIWEGLCVGLCSEKRVIGLGCVQSIDPLRLCHSVPLGEDSVLVSIQEVFFPNQVHDYGELFPGAFLVWPKCRLRRLEGGGSTRRNVRPSESDDDSNGYDSDDSSLSCGGGVGGGYCPIPRDAWRDMMVKVIDDDNLVFAIASIRELDAFIKLGGILLGNTHVGIIIREFVDTTTVDHL